MLKDVTNLCESELDEGLTTSFDSDGNRVRRDDKKTRERNANQHSSLSKAERKKIARKSARTRMRDAAGQRSAKVKRDKAIQKRQLAGFK